MISFTFAYSNLSLTYGYAEIADSHSGTLDETVTKCMEISYLSVMLSVN